MWVERGVRLCLALAVALTSCAPASESYSMIESTASSLAAPPTTVESTALATVAVTPTTLPRYQTLVAHATDEVKVYPAPNAPISTRTVAATTILGSPTVFPVLDGPALGWLKVALPGRPNEATGWVEADQFTFASVDQLIEVDLADATLSFFSRDELVLQTEVAIGSPENPTPRGRFFLTDIVQLTDPSGPWGPYALGLSARSDTITEFNGGDGIIGIHGTNRPDRIGEPVSLGCVRMPNDVIVDLAKMVQLGIPVVIK